MTIIYRVNLVSTESNVWEGEMLITDLAAIAHFWEPKCLFEYRLCMPVRRRVGNGP